jgi:hypothetical protein
MIFGERMTSTPLDESPKRNAIPRPVMCAIVFVGTLGIGGLMRWAAEGPTRPGFWPFIILLAIGLAVFTYFRPIPYLMYNEKPPETVPTALLWAVVWGTIEAAIFWTLYYFAWSETRFLGVAVIMGALGATNRYFHGRHLKKRHRAQILAAIVLLLIFVGAKYAAKH